jgi:uncharacterized protein
MLKEITIKLAPSEIDNETLIVEKTRTILGLKKDAELRIQKVKSSLDARKHPIHYQLKLKAFINEPIDQEQAIELNYQDVHNAKEELVIIGAGPAGLFCALRCLELGIKPIIFERGKKVRDRRRDLAALNKEGILNEESNYCFGEGGAGTYSDGKLYTRSKKRGSVQKMLQIFIRFGADEKIGYEAHPHIGTNKLPKIIENIRAHIIACGGEINFEKKLTDIYLKENKITGIELNNSIKVDTQKLVLATGHSAKDIYLLLHRKEIALEEKDFAIGVRIEHPQQLINEIQYGRDYARAIELNAKDSLPPASYSLVEQVNGRGVFSFCMCPGGIIAPASTQNKSLVVNGWSPSKRNNPYANSGLVVKVGQEDFKQFEKEGVLAGLYFQESIEQKAYEVGGGKFVAPAQKVADLIHSKTSQSIGEHSYLPGVTPSNMQDVLPDFIYKSIQRGIKQFSRRVKNYIHPEAIVVATESRTSSPLRIPRDKETLEHIQIKGLYPCAEGAGYAGGIISAAIDGERVADMVNV